MRNRRALGLPQAEADRPAGREAGPRGATRSRRARSCATPAARQLRRRPHVQPRRTGSAAPAGRGPRRVWAASLARASGSLGPKRPHQLGAEFATHLKVARNRDLPNPGPPRTAQARSGPRGGARSGGAACALKGGDPQACGRGPWLTGSPDREDEGMGSEDKMVEQQPSSDGRWINAWLGQSHAEALGGDRE